jgi:hypothetical protein
LCGVYRKYVIGLMGIVGSGDVVIVLTYFIE